MDWIEKGLQLQKEVELRVGDFVENKITETIQKRFEAPVPDGELKEMSWYQIPIPAGMSGDGSEYHVYLKKGTGDDLCIFLSGGGVAWNEYTAARPVTGGKVAAGLPNYYWNNLRPFTQIMNINTGITEIGNGKNPFDSWNFLIVTYATGDFHIGNHDFPYVDTEGREQVLHFHGHRNFTESMKVALTHFREPKRLLLAGDSAGAFAVPALAGEIAENYYPSCRDITLLSDSGQLLYRRWRRTAREVWQAPEDRWRSIHSSNITLDWYQDLYRRFGDRFRYLYASSARDYLLSAYYNDVAHRRYETDHEVQEIFYRQLTLMVDRLRQAIPDMGFFIYDWKNYLMLQGGTVHTAVRKRYFYQKTHTGETMADWLSDAVEGRVRSVGLDLLQEGKKG